MTLPHQLFNSAQFNIYFSVLGGGNLSPNSPSPFSSVPSLTTIDFPIFLFTRPDRNFCTLHVSSHFILQNINRCFCFLLIEFYFLRLFSDELQKTWHSTVIGCQKLGVGTRLGIAFFIFFSTFLFIQFRLKPDVRNMHSAHVVQNVDLDKSLLTVSQLRINFAIGSGSNILNVYLDETMDPNAVLKLVPLVWRSKM